MGMPEEEKRGVPAYMVSFGDMITLLLTFFILLVALADTQSAGLVGAGQGPLIPHMMAAGKPGILPGRLREDRQKKKKDQWWIPDQEGTPDELERVQQKLDEEIPTRFRLGEASLHYSKDQLVLRLPARIEYAEDGRPMLTPALRATLRTVAQELRADATLIARVNGDVPRTEVLAVELRESMLHARLVHDTLIREGVPPSRVTMWGWGASRPISRSESSGSLNRGLTIDLVRIEGDTNG